MRSSLITGLFTVPRLTFVLLLFLLAGGASQPAFAPDERRFVNGIHDFVHHIHAHRERVELLGQRLVTLFPDYFAGVDPILLGEFLRLHDQSKLTPSPSPILKAIAQRLYIFYGRSDRLDRLMFDTLIAEINSADRDVTIAFFRRNGMLDTAGRPNATALLFLQIEAVADSVDRARDEVSPEEFGKTMVAASLWFRERDRRQESILSEGLEAEGVYETTTKGHRFHEVRARRVSRCEGILDFWTSAARKTFEPVLT